MPVKERGMYARSFLVHQLEKIYAKRRRFLDAKAPLYAPYCGSESIACG
jgi:hypothetical protein